MIRQPVPFKTLLERILEPNGYTLAGNFRYFNPPVVPGKPMRKIGFPVEPGGLVKPEHAQQIIDIIEEDSKRPAP